MIIAMAPISQPAKQVAPPLPAEPPPRAGPSYRSGKYLICPGLGNDTYLPSFANPFDHTLY